MKHAKRISIIAKGKSLISELLKIREGRINRAVASAIDTAEENSINADEKVISLLNKLGECEPDEINKVLNEIIEAMDEAESWRTRKLQVQKIQQLLNEEVEVSEE